MEPVPLQTRADVAELLEVPARTLTWWVYALAEHRRYETFEIRRRNGGLRRIDAPIKPIKDIQRRLALLLNGWYAPPAHAHGFVNGRSPLSNARLHRRKEWVLRVDLHDFFGTIHFGRVRGLFEAQPFGYPRDVAALLAQICCHVGRLPQGAPTSPVVSNFICRRMDSELAALARKERCNYTRYADDLCFSTDRTRFPEHLAETEAETAVAGSAINAIVSGNGFAINAGKTRLMRRTQRQRVTGLVVNEKLNVTREYTRRLRNVLYIWQAHGPESAATAFARAEPDRNWPPGKPLPGFRQIIVGRVQHVGSVKGWEDPVYMRLALALAAVDDQFEARAHRGDSVMAETVPEMLASQRVELYTEGPTDLLHLSAAHAYFVARGEFTEFEFMPSEYPGAGDDALLKHCRALSHSHPRDPCLFVFDRDVARTVEAGVGTREWKNWGHGVVAVALGTPRQELIDKPFCIEMLYDRELTARSDADGRRLFLADEFSDQGVHDTKLFMTPDQHKLGLVKEAVYELPDERSVGLSKMAFAQAVAAAVFPFEDVQFEGFRATFVAIADALAEAVSDIRGG